MKINVLRNWLEDIPHQFLAKKNIEILIKAFSKQLGELYRVYEELNLITDIDTAEGRNLDYVGTILSLSRKDAAELAGFKEEIDHTMSDDLYRKYLRYKRLLNTNDCTYFDMMEGLSLLIGEDEKIYYLEDPNLPATVVLRVPFFSKGKASGLVRVPMVKPAGVRLLINGEIRDNIIYVGSVFLSGELVTIHPFIQGDIEIELKSYYASGHAVGYEITEIAVKE